MKKLSYGQKWLVMLFAAMFLAAVAAVPLAFPVPKEAPFTTGAIYWGSGTWKTGKWQGVHTYIVQPHILPSQRQVSAKAGFILCDWNGRIKQTLPTKIRKEIRVVRISNGETVALIALR